MTSSGESKSSPAPSTGDLRSFWMLIATMFQGALSDNIYKLIIVMLVLGLADNNAARELGDAASLGEVKRRATELGSAYQAIVGAIFTLPFALAVAAAGWLGDRFSKAHVTVGTKVLEVAVMILATILFIVGPMVAGENTAWVATGVLFFMGLQSALFSPSKYGIMPELLPESRIGWANGIMQGFTFVAVVVGTIAGPWLFETFRDRLYIAGLVLVGLAAIGTATSLGVRKTPPANPEEQFTFNPLPLVTRYSKVILASVGMRWGILGGVIWWGVAVALQGAVVLTASTVLGLSPSQTGLALMPVVIGMGLGSFAVSLVSRDRIELGLVPVGALGMFFTCLVMWLAVPLPEYVATLKEANPTLLWIYQIALPLGMGVVGFTTGFFIVPLEAYVVATCDAHYRAGVLATYNVFGAVGMILGSLLGGEISKNTGNTGDVFLACGVAMLITCGIIGWRFPQIIASLPNLWRRPAPTLDEASEPASA